MARPHIFKRTYLINKPLQLKYAVWIGAALLVMALLVQVHTYLTIESILPNLFSSVVGRQVKAIQTWLLVNSLIYLALVAFLSVFLSHKVAGPVYRFETAIREMLDSGDPARRIALRKGDELQSLADLLNRLIERFSQTKR
jgi:signal transduction histidine kinase